MATKDTPKKAATAQPEQPVRSDWEANQDDVEKPTRDAAQQPGTR